MVDLAPFREILDEPTGVLHALDRHRLLSDHAPRAVASTIPMSHPPAGQKLLEPLRHRARGRVDVGASRGS